MSRAPTPAQLAARIKPGQVLNPNGRPKKVLTAAELFDQQIKRDIKAAAKENSPEAYRFLLEVMRDTTVSVQHRLSAATQILDRAHGKPTNQTEISVSVYDKMDEQELIKLITGVEIEGELVSPYDEESSEDSSEED